MGNGTPLPGCLPKALTRPLDILRAEILRPPTTRNAIHDRGTALLAGPRDFAQNPHEHLRRGDSIPRPFDDLSAALGGVRTLAAGDHGHLRKQTARSDHAPETSRQLQFILDHEVCEIVGKGRLRAVIGRTVEAHRHPVAAASKSGVRPAVIAMERHVHGLPAYRGARDRPATRSSFSGEGEQAWVPPGART